MDIKIFVGLSVALSLFLGGCGDSDNSCRIDVQVAMDKGNFSTAISKLNGECKDTFSKSDRYYTLALAYMGEAGYSISNIVSTLIEASDNNNNTTFTTFTSNMSKNRSTSSSLYLKKSQEYFLSAVQTDPTDTLKDLCKNADPTNRRLNNTCYYYGLNQTVTTVDTISYLTKNIDAVVESIDNGSNNTPSDMQASLDALSWALNSSANIKGTVQSVDDINISGNSYKHLTILENGATFFRLATSNAQDENASTVLTSGYCDVNGSKTVCDSIENSDGSIDVTNAASTSCYACPVGLETNATMNVVDLLVDAINEGTDTISNISNDEDTKDSIEDIKNEIDINGNGTVEKDEIVAYLNK